MFENKTFHGINVPHFLGNVPLFIQKVTCFKNIEYLWGQCLTFCSTCFPFHMKSAMLKIVNKSAKNKFMDFQDVIIGVCQKHSLCQV